MRVGKYYPTYECYSGSTCIILLWASALLNYVVACLLMWASTYVMTMSISFLIEHFLSKIQIPYGGSMLIIVL